jgi:small subunit ribosomal protein S20
MANIASAKKRAIQAVTRQARNTTLRSRVYTYLKKARKAIANGAKEEAVSSVRAAFSQIDKMVPKGIFHKNKAARLKSRLNTKLKKLVLS